MVFISRSSYRTRERSQSKNNLILDQCECSLVPIDVRNQLKLLQFAHFKLLRSLDNMIWDRCIENFYLRSPGYLNGLFGICHAHALTHSHRSRQMSNQTINNEISLYTHRHRACDRARCVCVALFESCVEQFSIQCAFGCDVVT